MINYNIKGVNKMRLIKSLILENRWIILFCSILLLVRLLIFPLYSVDGASMDYTLADGELVLGTNQFEIERFDIVIIDVPELNEYYVKRVIGLPGDKVEYINDELYINHEFIEEPFLAEKKAEWELFTKDFSIEEVPDNEYFVLGDNRRNSTDSRKMGPINETNILSELIAVYWPLNKMQFLNE